MSQYQIICKQIDNGLSIIHTYSKDKPLIPIETNLILRFFISFNYTELIHKTNIKLFAPSNECCFLNFTENIKEIIFSDSNIIPLSKQVNNEEHEDISRIHSPIPAKTPDGVYQSKKDNDKIVGYLNLKNINQNGFIDTEIPANTTIENTIKRNVLFNERKFFLKYRIFDRYSKYDSFKIDTKNNTIEFQSRKTGSHEYELISEEAWAYSDLSSNSLTLVGNRLNGRTTTIKEKLSPPSIKNLEMNDKNNIFYSTAFIYA